MRLKSIDTATELLPEPYYNLAFRLILTGRINESVDLTCSKGEEPTLQDVHGDGAHACTHTES